MKDRPYEQEKRRTPLLPIEEMEMQVMSDTDMTGLIASGVQSEGELESYAELCHFQPTVTDTENL